MMDLVPEIIRHVIFPLWLFKDGKGRVLKYLREFERSQFLTESDIRERQLQKLLLMVRHAYANCEFYRRRLDDIGVRPSEIKDFRDYQKIPVLTKRDIQENLNSLLAKNYPQEELVTNWTGGSTGSPLRFFHDKERMLSREASTLRHDAWAGHQIGQKLAVIWGHRQDLSIAQSFKARIRNALLDRSRILDCSSMTDESMGQFANTLRVFRPRVILSYAVPMFLFARYCQTNRITDIRPLSIITSAEVLLEEERRTIEEVFGCRVFDRYGCREVAVIASECEEHGSMHLNAETLYVEFLNEEGNPVKPGELGFIIITDLLNFGMPFIRYKIEDVGTPNDQHCPCGRGLPLMRMVAGRTTDFLRTPKGVRVSGTSLATYFITSVPGIRQAQIVQDQIDHLVFKLVTGPEFRATEAQLLREKAVDFFGEEMRYDIQHVEEIPKEASGKYRFSVCYLNDNHHISS
ncbi:MAG TPA: phenylacetate--CoA ligase family protein [Candidatus Hydrogenedentes bacterium]|nr:phenylacetate--CoA ligase family protein [Candidatus Hydrogenedentota bacterium]